MGIQAPVLVHDDNARQFFHLASPRVGARGPDKVSLDAPVPLWRGNGHVCGLDPIVGLGNLLRLGVIRHQRLDDRRRGQTADRKSFYALQKIAPADLPVNIAVVEFDGLVRELGSHWLHRRGSFPRRRIPRSLPPAKPTKFPRALIPSPDRFGTVTEIRSPAAS